MTAARLHSLLASPARTSEGDRVFWLTLGLMFSLVFSFLALREAFAGDYIVQDDARQHVFWMQRFMDGALFPGDRIADYFQSVSPYGYTTLYKILVAGDFSPWWVNKVLPLVLGLISTAYCFGVSLQLLPLPMGGFFATLLLNQSLWMKDDLVSATPRAFVYPIFLAFLFYLLRRSPIGTAVSAGLLGLFYPQYSLIALGLLVLQLLRWQPDPTAQGWVRYVPVRWSTDRQDYWTCGSALIVSVVILGIYAASSSSFDPVISAANTRDWAELNPGGRSTFFRPNPLEFYFTNLQSGMLTVGLVRPATLLLAVGLPVMLRWRDRFPLAQSLNHLWILPQLLGVSLFWFITAHATLFRLHLPARYTEHSWRIVFAFAAALVLTLLIDQTIRRFSVPRPPAKAAASWEWGAAIAVLLLTVLVVVYPSIASQFPTTKYKVGSAPQLYKFLRNQPMDTLVASLSLEADNIPSFAQRSVLVAREYAIPYHWGYYGEFRERAIALIQAQYTPDLDALKAFINKYGIDFWVLDRRAYEEAYLETAWFDQYAPPTNQALQYVREGTPSALNGLRETCIPPDQVLEGLGSGLEVLDAACILNAEPTAPPEDASPDAPAAATTESPS